MSTTVMALIRHILTFAGGAAVTLGWMDEATVQALIGAGATVIGILWSLWDKKATAAKLEEVKFTSSTGSY